MKTNRRYEMSAGGVRMRRQGARISTLNDCLQVWINPRLSAEGRAALAARVIAEAIRMGYLYEDMFSHVLVKPSSVVNPSVPSAMRLRVERDSDLFAFEGTRDLDRLGYCIKLVTSIDGVDTGTARIQFTDDEVMGFANKFGLAGKREKLVRILDVTRREEVRNQYVVDERFMWNKDLARFLINTATDELVIIPKWRGHKLYKDESQLVLVL